MVNAETPSRAGIRLGAKTTEPAKTIAHFEPNIKPLTFGHLGPRLFARGLPVIPVNGKIPAVKGWNTQAPSEEQVDVWATKHATDGVGIVCGHGAVAAIDLDLYDPDLSEEIARIFGYLHAAPCRIGEWPKRMLLIRAPGLQRKLLSASYRGPDGKVSRIEVLSYGQQFVAAGIHPGTKQPYSGLDYASLSLAGLPEVPLDDLYFLIDTFEAKVSQRGWEQVSARPASSASPGSVDKHLPPAAPHQPAVSPTKSKTVLDNFNLNGHDRFQDMLFDQGWTPTGRGTFTVAVSGITSQVDGERFCRPGKTAGVSATLFADPQTGAWRFHLFSSSVPELEPGNYLISHAYCQLVHEGNYSEAIQALRGAGFTGAEDDFSDYAGAEASRLKRKRSAGFRFVSEKELLANGPARPEWLIDGLIQAGTFNTIVAAPRSFKTFFAISLGVSVASGLPWFGRTVKPGPVCFLIGEGHHGFGTRLQAAKLNMDLRLDEPLPLYISSSALAIPDQADAEKLATSLAVIEEAEGEPIRLLVVDTLGRNFGGHDENSAQGMGAFVNNLLDSVSPKTAVVVLHHSGWSDQSRARGSSSLFGATDGEFLLTRKDSVVEVSCRKMKDAPEPEHPLVFRAKNMVISCDDDGPIESLVLEPAGPITVQPVLSATRQRALELLEELTTDDTGVDFEQWHETCAEEGVYVKESSFKRGVAWLERSHFIWNRGARFWIRKMGDLNPPEPKARTDVN